MYRTPTITEKAYRTSVPYFLTKIEAYRTAILAFQVKFQFERRVLSSEKRVQNKHKNNWRQ